MPENTDSSNMPIDTYTLALVCLVADKVIKSSDAEAQLSKQKETECGDCLRSLHILAAEFHALKRIQTMLTVLQSQNTSMNSIANTLELQEQQMIKTVAQYLQNTQVLLTGTNTTQGLIAENIARNKLFDQIYLPYINSVLQGESPAALVEEIETNWYKKTPLAQLESLIQEANKYKDILERMSGVKVNVDDTINKVNITTPGEEQYDKAVPSIPTGNV